LVADRIRAAAGTAPWQAFAELDDILTKLAADADARLAFQSSFAAR
jgi:hypothetical protein